MKFFNKLICIWLAAVMLCGSLSVTAGPGTHNKVYFDDNFGGGMIPKGWELDSTGGRVWATDGALNLERTNGSGEKTAMRRYVNPDKTPIDGKVVLEVEAVQNTAKLTQFFIYGRSGITMSIRFEASGRVNFALRNNKTDTDPVNNPSANIYPLGSVIKLRLEIDTLAQLISVYEGDELTPVALDKYTRGGNAAQLSSFYFWNQATDLGHFELRKFKLCDSETFLSDRQALESAAENLTFNLISKEAADDITQNIYLPQKGFYDSDITWDNGGSEAIDLSGNVFAQEDENRDAAVTLRATLHLNGLELEKVFTLVVVRQLGGAATVNRIYDYLTFSMISEDDINAVSHNLNLIEKMYDADIVWVSDKPQYVDGSGIVTRPPASEGDVLVTLTANITSGALVRTKEFFLTISNLATFFDPMQVSDEDFFGVWNNAQAKWTVEGQINYAYAPGLSKVEGHVKDGDYSSAKQSLLEYYQKKQTDDIRMQPTARNTTDAKLTMDNIFPRELNMLSGEFTLPTEYTDISLDVPISHLTKESMVSFILIGRVKDDGVAEFASKESGANAPVLELTVNGNKLNFPAAQDAYIRAGAYGDATYGADDPERIEVKDSGAPFDDESRRGLLMFNLSAVKESDKITKATVKLYGRSVAAAPKRIMVMTEGDISWVENTVSWNSITGKTYSWQGINGGTDWNIPPGGERQWDYFVARAGWLRTLTNEYQYTKDETYAYHALRNWLDLIYDKGDALCVPGYGDGIGGYPRTLDSGIRVTRTVPCYYAVVTSKSMTKEANVAILKQFWMNGEFLKKETNFHSDGNWGGSETAGLLYLSLYFPEFVNSSGESGDGTKWENIATSRITQMMKELIYPDGSYHEATSFYTEGQFNTNVGYKRLAAQFGREMGPEFDKALLGLAYCILQMYAPSGDSIAYGDSDPSTRGDNIMKDVLKWYNDPVLEYIISFGMKGKEPDFTSQLYPDSRLVFMRGGWNKNAPYLFTNAKGGIGGHGHGDDLAVFVASYGRALLIDPGRYHYVYTDPKRIWVANTIGHNTIEINGKTQRLEEQLGAIEAWTTNGSFDFAKLSTPNNLGFWHTRNILFIRPSYWIVSDYITADDPTKSNTYRQLWHTLPNAKLALDVASKSFYTNFDEGANISVTTADPQTVTASVEDGLYAIDSTSIVDAKYGQYLKSGKGNVTFDTVLYPTPGGRKEKVGVRHIALDVPDTQATALEITIVDEEHQNSAKKAYYYLAQEEQFKADRAFGDYQTDAAMAYVQYSTTGRLKELYLREGSMLKKNNQILLDGVAAEDIGVTWEARDMYINSADASLNLESLKIMSDVTVNKVYVNKRQVAFTQDNNIVALNTSVNIPPDNTQAAGNSTPTGGGGGSVDAPNLPPAPIPVPPAPPAAQFGDISGHWAQKDIEYLAGKGIVKGDSNHFFMPDQVITRAEFAAIIVRALNLPPAEYTNLFEDVGDEDWHAGVVQAAFDYGIISGLGDGRFDPDSPVTREQVAKMLVFALERKSNLSLQTDSPDFSDNSEISPWAFESIGKAFASGLINGTGDGAFAPLNSASRAEAAAMIHRFINAMDQMIVSGGSKDE